MLTEVDDATTVERLLGHAAHFLVNNWWQSGLFASYIHRKRRLSPFSATNCRQKYRVGKEHLL